MQPLFHKALHAQKPAMGAGAAGMHAPLTLKCGYAQTKRSSEVCARSATATCTQLSTIRHAYATRPDCAPQCDVLATASYCLS